MIISSINSLGSARRGAAGYRWVYAGANSDTYARVAETLGHDAGAVSPESFQQFVSATRSAFMKWIDQSISNYGDHDWLTDAFERNPLRNNLFLTFCWLRWLERRITQSSQTPDLIVVVDAFDVLDAVERLARRLGQDVTVFGRARLNLMWRMLYWRELASGFTDLVEWAVRFAAAAGMERDHNGADHSETLLAVTYVTTPGVIGRDGQYSDQFYPGMSAWYAKHGIAVRFLPWITGVPLWQLPSLVRKLARTRALILPERLLSISQLLLATISWMSTVARSKPRVTGSDDTQNELAVALRRTSDFNAIHALSLIINGLAVDALPRHIGQRGVLLWYENQTKDKYLLRRFKMSGRHVIAVQSFTACPNHVSLFITEGERRLGVAPDRVWVPGAPFMRHAMFDSRHDYAAVPCWRYQAVASAQRQTVRVPGSPFMLLIALPYNGSDAHWVMQLARESIARVRARNGIIRVKAHGSASAKELASLRTQFEVADAEWTPDSIASLLRDAAVVFSAGTSVVIEALAQGVPTIVAGAVAGLTMNPAEGLADDLCRTVYSTRALLDEVDRQMERWDGNDQPPDHAGRDWFEYLDRDSKCELLSLAN